MLIDVLLPLIAFLTTSLGAILIWVLKDMKSKVDRTLTQAEIRQLIADRLEPVHVELKNIKDNIQQIDVKLDSLIELTLRSHE